MSQPTPEIEAPAQAQALLPPAGIEKPGTETTETAPPEPPKEPSRSEPSPRRRRWPYALVLIALALAGFLWYRSHRATAASAKTGSAKGGRAGAPAAIPVVSAQAQRGDIDVYVTGLGAITPIATVTVKSRVDGQLMNVHFKEGDLVHQGDPLIEIDPRPYQAIVEQTEGQLTRDQALLANARVDVNRYQTLLSQDAIPEQQLATQRALVTQYEGTVKKREVTGISD